MLISIIVPVYNLDKYISKCIESILSQTYTYFELLLIDDGSSDTSGSICDKYAAVDERIHVYHKKNGGVSSARNVGLKYANGEWVCFVDADDWIENDFLKCCVESINTSDKNIDLLVAGYSLDYLYNVRNSKVVRFNNEFIDLYDISNLDYVNDIFLHGTICSKFYNKKVIDNANLKFDEKVPINEDSIFFWQFLLCTNRLLTIDNVMYHYMHGFDINSSRKLHSSATYLYIAYKEQGIFSCILMKYSIDVACINNYYCTNWLMALYALYKKRETRNYRKAVLINEYQYSVGNIISYKPTSWKRICVKYLLIILVLFPVDIIDAILYFLIKPSRIK